MKEAIPEEVPHQSSRNTNLLAFCEGKGKRKLGYWMHPILELVFLLIGNSYKTFYARFWESEFKIPSSSKFQSTPVYACIKGIAFEVHAKMVART